jgi:hypothetical protein
VVSGAYAAGACSGTITASLAHSLPVPLIVALQTHVDGSTNPSLVQRFVDGLRRGGISLSREGNVTLRLALSLGAPLRASGTMISGSYKAFEWATEEQTSAPQAQRHIRADLLSLSATLVDNVEQTQSWVASIQCVVQTDDSGALAEDIGEIIGHDIGQTIVGQRF